MPHERAIRVALAAVLAATAGLAGAGGPPATEKRPVTNAYHGVTVIDDYRWLENWDDAAVKSWSEAQNAHARSVLDALSAASAIRERVKRLLGGITGYGGLTWRKGRLLAIKFAPPREQPSLVILDGPDDLASERTVLDPLALDPKGGTSIDWYVPSLDAALVAVSLSASGSERGNVHVYETATGKQVAEVVPRVNYGTAGGSLAWAPDSSGFYYTRYPRPGERPAEDLDFYTQVYFHRLGTPTEQDRYEIGTDFPRIAEIRLEASFTSGYLLANVQNGDGGEFAQYLRAPDGTWTQLTGFKDKVVHAVFGLDQSLYFLSRSGAPHGKVLRLMLAATRAPRMADAQVVVPEDRDAVIAHNFGGADTILPTASRLYVVDLVGGPNQIRVFTPTGERVGSVPVPPVAAVWELTRTEKDAILYRTSTFTEPPAWHQFSGQPAAAHAAADAAPARLPLSSTSPADFSDTEVIRDTAVSKDGTRVPLNIIRRKGTVLNGKNPTLLTGYGGYGISLSPFFLGVGRVWLDQGGVFVVANLRGGGEFGEEWHLAGNLTRKQNVFDDFIAAAEWVIKSGYTTSERLAIEGGSNGGLLMGAALTQRPHLFKAVVSHVGIYDMLRVENSPNGTFNVPEFGTVKDRDQFTALYAYSPYHRVKDDTRYPAVLFLTGANDPRVDPMHSRKMTARLQAATGPTGTVLLRTSASSGHGFGTSLSEAIEQEVDVYAFLFNKLGVEYRPMPDPSGSDALVR